MSNATPGPWHYDGTIVTCGEGDDEGHVATPGSPLENPGEERANGYLIAESPAMLDMLKLILAGMACTCRLDGYVGKVPPCETCRIEAVIARAEGGAE